MCEYATVSAKSPISMQLPSAQADNRATSTWGMTALAFRPAQENVDSANENESEDAERPQQCGSVGTDTRREGDTPGVEPETYDEDERRRVRDDDPGRKTDSLDRATTTKLGQQ